VGTDVANRNRIEVEGLIGFFVNNLALRADLSGNPTFRELLARVRTVALGAYTHQSLPFASLVKAMRVKRSLSHSALFQVLCVLQSTPQSEATLSDLEVTFVDGEQKTSKFDLALFISETEDELFESWVYSTDLFKPETVAQMGADFQSLLENAVEHPDITLSQLKVVSGIKRKKMRSEKTQFEKVKGKGFMRGSQRSVSLSDIELIRTSYLKPDGKLPLVMEPNVKDIDLVAWAAANQDFIEAELYKHGALLFRGFNVDTIPEFERFADAASRGIFGDYGDLPREQESERVYQSTPYPNDQAILFHNESSHLTHWPMKQFFYCVEPAESGGETPIVDCRLIYAALPPELVEQFERRQLMYVRNFTESLDVHWRAFFRTDDPEAVAAYCRNASMDFEWKGESLRTKQLRAAVTRHPKTNETVFFNQIQLHHISCIDPSLREALFSFFALEELPRNVYYGDGGSIEDATVQTIIDTYWKNAVSFLWQKGDILMLDNMLIAHGRLPYAGARKIVVAMGDMLTQENLQGGG
jgi:Non-ribosomal peptide synthetase modules and related proteins